MMDVRGCNCIPELFFKQNFLLSIRYSLLYLLIFAYLSTSLMALFNPGKREALKLIYLTEANLTDRLFVREFVSNYKLADKALLLHDTVEDSISNTRFATKRVSSLLSEAMVYNNAFSAEQRNFFRPEGDSYHINTQLIEELMVNIQLLLLSPVVKHGEKSTLGNPIEMINAARTVLDIDEVLLFTMNPLSPLGAKREIINNQEDVDRLLALYEEEAATIQLAWNLHPARINSPQQYTS